MALEHLQIYWWLIISVLGALLVFLLFVQGGQSMLLDTRNAMDRTLMVNSLGRKWELTFTTLVVFGGAFFASFPLFYSTSFGGLILVVDAHPVQLRGTGRQLSVPSQER